MNGNRETNKPTIFSARVISLGRITIPDELRTLHGIQEGDIVEFEIRSVQKTSNPREEGA